MSTGAEVAKAFTEAGFPGASVDATVRYLREAMLVPKSARGRPGARSPRWDAEHFANFILAQAADQPIEAPAAVNTLRPLELQRTTLSGSFRDWAAGTTVETSTPTASRWGDNPPPLGKTLEFLVTMFARMSPEERQETENKSRGSFISLSSSYRTVSFFWTVKRPGVQWETDHYEVKPRQNALMGLLALPEDHPDDPPRRPLPRLYRSRSTSVDIAVLVLAGELLAETHKRTGGTEGADNTTPHDTTSNETAPDLAGSGADARDTETDTDATTTDLAHRLARAAGHSDAGESKGETPLSQALSRELGRSFPLFKGTGTHEHHRIG